MMEVDVPPLGLVVDSGRIAGQKFVLGASKASIGRSPENEIVLRDPSVSPCHASIQRWNNQWWIADLGSATGTFVNGRRLLRPVTLSPGDVVRLGNVCFKVLGEPPKVKRRPSAKAVPYEGNRPSRPQRSAQGTNLWLIAGPPLLAFAVILLLLWTLIGSSTRAAVPTVSPRAPEPLAVISPAPRAVPSPPTTFAASPTPLSPPILGRELTPEATITPVPAPQTKTVPVQAAVPSPTLAPPSVIWGEPLYRFPDPKDPEFAWVSEKEQNVTWVFTIVLTATGETSGLSGPFFYARGEDGSLRQVTTYVQTPLSAGGRGTFLAFCRRDEYIAKAILYKDGLAFHYDFRDARP